jgi:predicted transcriptional regulator
MTNLTGEPDVRKVVACMKPHQRIERPLFAWQAFRVLFEAVEVANRWSRAGLVATLNEDAEKKGLSARKFYTKRALDFYTADPEKVGRAGEPRRRGRQKHLFQFLNEELARLGKREEYALPLALIEPRCEELRCHENYWQSRRSELIPNFLWNQIDDKLRRCRVIAKEKLNTDLPHQYFISSLGSVKNEFWGISPIFHEKYVEAVIYMATKNPPAKADLVFTPNVSALVIKSLKERRCLNLVKTRRICWSINTRQDIEHGGIAGSESFMSLCLESNLERDYFDDKLLVGEDEPSIAWGKVLFEHHKSYSRPFVLV